MRNTPSRAHFATVIAVAILVMRGLALAAEPAAPTVTIHAAGSKPVSQDKKPTFPSTFFKNSPDMQRFSDPGYFKMLASDGIRTSDPKALFRCISSASQAGEGYKALYLSRIFTELQPENRTGWSNRARLASGLGFQAEAVAAQANVESESVRPVRGAAAPGNFTVRPSTLADWAAALALAADDTAAREGRAVVLAVRDDLSGVSVASREEIQRENRGPWATPKPVQIEDVLPNLFAMTQAKPMDRKSVNGGMFTLGMLAMAGSSYSTRVGAADAASQFAELSGNAMARASEVASEYKGGTFVAVTYPAGVARSATLVPKTAGKYEATGTPLPMLWASGASLGPTVTAAWKSGDSTKSNAIKIDAKTKKQEWKKYELPALSYPKVQEFCAADVKCSAPMTVLEVMLTAEDLRELAPDTESRHPDLAPWTSRYAHRQSMTVATAGSRFTGFDSNGVVYITRHQPTEWLTTAATSPKK